MFIASNPKTFCKPQRGGTWTLFALYTPPGGHILPRMTQLEQNPKRIPFHLTAIVLAALFWAGCAEQAEPTKREASTATNAAMTAPAKTGPGPGEKVCFTCQGQGTVACRVAGCVHGQAECPGPCMKLTRGTWVKMNVPGHDPNELWQKFPNQSGKGGYQSWNHHHVGEVITYQNGVAVNIGPCKTCSGSTKVTCRVCKGAGTANCELCRGKKFIPTAWTPTDNPWFNSQPDVIRLADGRVLLGRIAATSGDDNTIVTRDKKVFHVNSSDILPNSGTNR
ncbi:MAG TPA: hypothetical protein VN673_08800 [Clostridia bacterium]|nr:hypothetical protein [Clostridia bacterium]